MIFKVFQQFMYKQTCYFFSLERSVQFTLTTINYFWTNYLVSSASVNPIYFKEMSKTIKSKNKTDAQAKGKDSSVIKETVGNDSTSNLNQNTFFTSNLQSSKLGKKKSVKKKKKKNFDLVTDVTTSLSKLSVDSKQKLSKKTSIPTTTPVRNKSHSAGNTRTTSSRYESLEDIAKYIKNRRAKNVIVMCGAGISTASGIPDFRTPGTGLYHNLKKYNVPAPTAVFDMDYFRMKPKPFFELAKELYPSGKYRPNVAHYFLRSLHEKGLLLRLYTQNIDGLERLAGIPPVKLVEAHGTFATASCTKCGKKYNGESIKERIFKNIIPRCDLTPLCWGVIKPDIVFFGEDLPKRFYYYLKDFPHCDLLIVIGTSLEVEPFASLVDSIRPNVPRLLINRERVGPFKSRRRPTDAFAAGDIVRNVERLSTLLGWKKFVDEIMNDHEKLRQAEAMSDSQADSGISSASSVSSEVKETKSSLSLPPPGDNIKRYFHTVRSTPLPGSKSSATAGRKLETSPVPSNLSYFDYIRSKNTKINDGITAQKDTEKPLDNSFKNRAPTISYAQTIEKKKPTGRTQNCIPGSESDTTESASESTSSDSSND